MKLLLSIQFVLPQNNKFINIFISFSKKTNFSTIYNIHYIITTPQLNSKPLPNSVPITTQMSPNHYPAVGASIVIDDNIRIITIEETSSSFQSSPDGCGITLLNKNVIMQKKN